MKKKKALRKDFYMEIKRSLGRFLSIFFIVALGVSFFAGIRAAEPDMRLSGDEYFDEHNLADMKVISTMGLTEDDVEALANVKGVKGAEYAYSTDAMCRIGDTKKVVHIMSQLPDMNRTVVEEGRLPEKETECLLDIDFLKASGYKVGDEIHLESGMEDSISDSLKHDTYTIVGAGSSPCYISFERGSSTIGTGEVAGFMVVPEKAFSMDVYTEIYLSVDEAFDEVAFTKEYAGKVDPVVERIKDIKKVRQTARRDGIVEEAEEEIAEAEAELLDGKKELADGKKEYEDGKKELENGKQEIADGRKELEEGKRELEKGRQELADGRRTFESEKKKANAQLADAKKKLEDGQSELDRGKKELDSGRKELESAKGILVQKEEELEAGKAEYEAGAAKLAAGEAEIASQEAKLNEGKAAIPKLEGLIADTKSQAAQLEAGIPALEQAVADKSAAYETAKDAYEEALAGVEAGTVAPEEAAALKADMDRAKVEWDAALSKLSETKELYEKVKGSIPALEQKLQDTQSMIASGEVKLKTAKEQATESRKELEAAKQQLDEGQRQLDAGKAEISKNESKLSEAQKVIDGSEKELASGWKEYESGKVSAQKEFTAGERKLDEGERELVNAQNLISDNEQKLADAEKELEDGEKELVEAEQEILDAEKEIADGEQEIADARQEIADLEMPKWYVYDRDGFEQYTGYGENADRMRAIGEVFPVLFFLVAALISLTTMTRMVEEQRTQIGTLKALGYSKFSIAGKYLGYAFAATLSGSIVGVLVGEKLYPYIIVTAYKIMYPHLPNVVIPYNMTYAVMATGAAIACTMLATIFSCYKELMSQPAVLMRPPAPKQGKRVFLEYVPFIWRRLSFIWKSTIRNLIRYKKRFFMTVFGIGGCMALILVGYGLRDSIFNIAVIQYEDIQLYDMMAILDEDASEEEKMLLKEYMEETDDIDSVMDIYMKSMPVGKGNAEEDVFVFVPENTGGFGEFVNLEDRRTDETYELTDEGAVLTEKIAKMLDVQVGDTVTIKDEDAGEKEIEVTAICENYMGHYIYLTKNAYESLFGGAPKYNTKLLKVKDYEDGKAHVMGEEMLGTKAVINVQYMKNMRGQIEDMLTTLDSVIVILIAAAGALAFVVLYNLNNINITERRRELATIKVLGFYDKEVAAYVYRENILLTLIGAIAGCGLGYLLHRFVIVTVEVDDVMFGRNIDLKSYIIAMVFTFAFSAFVNWVMYFKLKRINMVESLKSVE